MEVKINSESRISDMISLFKLHWWRFYIPKMFKHFNFTNLQEFDRMIGKFGVGIAVQGIWINSFGIMIDTWELIHC